MNIPKYSKLMITDLNIVQIVFMEISWNKKKEANFRFLKGVFVKRTFLFYFWLESSRTSATTRRASSTEATKASSTK